MTKIFGSKIYTAIWFETKKKEKKNKILKEINLRKISILIKIVFKIFYQFIFPVWDENIWIDAFLKLPETFISYANYNKKCLFRTEKNHSRKVFRDYKKFMEIETIEIKENKYSFLKNLEIKPFFLSDFKKIGNYFSFNLSPFLPEDKHERAKVLEKINFSFPIEILKYFPGGNKRKIIYCWKIPLNRNQRSILKKNALINKEVLNFPIFFSRAMLKKGKKKKKKKRRIFKYINFLLSEMIFFLSNPKLNSLRGKNIINTLFNQHFEKKKIPNEKKLQNSNISSLGESKNFFSNIRAQLSKLIIDSGIKLEKKGRYLIAECPFHQENSPSLFVDDSKGVYHCFGCGASGNIYSFRKNLRKKIGKLDNVSEIYNENSSIKKYLSNSIKIRKNQNFFTSRFLDFLLIQISNSYFYYFFHKYKKPSILISLRNISPGIARIYEIGYSSYETKDLFKYLRNEKYSIKEILQTGIVFSKKNVYQNKKVDKDVTTFKNHYFFDMFRDRVIIPIRNCNGCVIGFGGRLISKKPSPKYINSSENNIFKKKKNIFSHSTLKETVLKDPKMVIIVEGYIDTITLFQNGIRFSVASLGTNFSFFQIKKSKNISINRHILIFFDSDKAGEGGISRFLEKIFSPRILKNLTLSITKIPVHFSAKDPDEFIVKKGTKNLIKQVINESVPILTWYENFFFSDLFNQYFLIEKIFFDLITLNQYLKKI